MILTIYKIPNVRRNKKYNISKTMIDTIDKKEIAKQYIKASVHYGHPPKEWNPKMAPYILYEKHGYHIFDLVKTSKLLHLAGNIVQKKAEKGGKFLFVGTNRLSASIIAQQAKRCDAYYINYRWLGGMLTNWSTVQKQITRLKNLEQQELDGSFDQLSKKEYSRQRKEIDRLRRLFNGIKEMTSLPDVVVFTNQIKDALAIQECLKLGIPTVSIVDTNCNPDLVPYPIPANDDSSSSINFILNYLVNRILTGYNNDYKK
jgi:small subunit ribosomal protein S2